MVSERLYEASALASQIRTFRTGTERIASESGARFRAHHLSKMTTRIKRMKARTLAAAKP